MITEQEMIEIARTVSRSRSEPWHDTDDIEGFILLKLSQYKPEKRHHAVRIARNAKVDWIRKERGSKGQKVSIRNTFDLSLSNAHTSEEEYLVLDLCEVLVDPAHRKIVTLLHEGYTQSEIAEQMSVSTYFVSQAIKTIRTHVAEYSRV